MDTVIQLQDEEEEEEEEEEIESANVDQINNVKTKTEIRNYIDEIESYILEKDTRLLYHFKQFKSDFLEKSNTGCQQTNLNSYLNKI